MSPHDVNVVLTRYTLINIRSIITYEPAIKEQKPNIDKIAIKHYEVISTLVDFIAHAKCLFLIILHNINNDVIKFQNSNCFMTWSSNETIFKQQEHIL